MFYSATWSHHNQANRPNHDAQWFKNPIRAPSAPKRDSSSIIKSCFHNSSHASYKHLQTFGAITPMDGLISLMSPWSLLQTDLNICRAAFKFRASLEQRQTSKICIRTASATWNPRPKNTLTPPLPTEESHRSCSRIAQCGRQKFDDNALKKQEGGSISTTTIELQSRQRRTCKCLVCRALMVLFS